MRISNFFVADAVKVDHGVLDVWRGFPEWWGVPALPCHVQLPVGITFELEDADRNRDHTLYVRVVEPDRATRPVDTLTVATTDVPAPEADGLRRVVLARRVPVVFATTGVHTLVLNDAKGQRLADYAIRVRLVTPAP